MATVEQLERALRNADAAGDVEAARAITKALKETRAGGGQAAPSLPEPSQASMSWGDVAKGAFVNTPDSAKRFVGDIASVVTDPIGTVKNLGNLGAGAVEKLIPGEQGHEQYADSVGKFFADRYGGMDNLKRTMATDPVGFLADASVVLSGGSMLASKVPTVSRALGTAARAVDPITNAARGVRAVGRAAGTAGSSALGLWTGAGGDSIRTAARAGYTGGSPARAVAENMRGAAPMENVVDAARTGISNLRASRNAEYVSGKAAWANGQPVSFAGIDRAVKKAKDIGRFTGRQSGVTKNINAPAQAALQKIDDLVTEWRNAPTDFHTPEGLDALKQAIGNIRDDLPFGSPGRKAASDVYTAVRSEIILRAPEYAKSMKAYENATSVIKELEKVFNAGDKAAVESTLRKLQSVMRNNVNTSWGRRADLARILQDAGATNLMEALAGQALSSPTPRGLQGLVASGAGIGSVATLAFNPMAWPALLAAAISTSPRLAGEAALLGGRAAGATARTVGKIPLRQGAAAAYQLDRVNQEPLGLR